MKGYFQGSGKCTGFIHKQGFKMFSGASLTGLPKIHLGLECTMYRLLDPYTMCILQNEIERFQKACLYHSDRESSNLQPLISWWIDFAPYTMDVCMYLGQLTLVFGDWSLG